MVPIVMILIEHILHVYIYSYASLGNVVCYFCWHLVFDIRSHVRSRASHRAPTCDPDPSPRIARSRATAPQSLSSFLPLDVVFSPSPPLRSSASATRSRQNVLVQAALQARGDPLELLAILAILAASLAKYLATPMLPDDFQPFHPAFRGPLPGIVQTPDFATTLFVVPSRFATTLFVTRLVTLELPRFEAPLPQPSAWQKPLIRRLVQLVQLDLVQLGLVMLILLGAKRLVQMVQLGLAMLILLGAKRLPR